MAVNAEICRTGGGVWLHFGRVDKISVRFENALNVAGGWETMLATVMVGQKGSDPLGPV
jgi:Zn-finger nucleic acid-binding protein